MGVLAAGAIGFATAVAASVEPKAQAADPASPLSGYCEPSATAFDPADVPPGGSGPVNVDGVRERTVTVDGVETRLLESGRRKADTAVVFMHGSPGSGADLADLLPQVSGRHNRAIAIDGPGYGQAEDAWARPKTIEPAVRFTERSLRKLGVRDVHLVAHDVGGGVGLEWGARHPKRLRSATLIDAGMLFDYRHHNLAQVSRTPGGGEAFWLGINRAAWNVGIQDGQSSDRPLPPEFTNRLYDDLDRETRCTIIDLYRGTDEPEIDQLARGQAIALRKRERRPALVIWGARDPYLPVKHAEEQRRGFPAAQIEIFEDSGHFPFADDPERTRNLIVPFLRDALAQDRVRESERPSGDSTNGNRNRASGFSRGEPPKRR